MAQAHRIKPETPAVRVGIFRFVHGLLRELCFWSLVVIALGMIGALATFHPEDPAWTHTATATRLHNLGGVVGAWFADVTLYFFGYAAYLLPLGVAFAGWRLFKRGAWLELDGEIVLFRVLGFVVTLATTCGLVALHLRAMPGTLPNAGSSGGLVGTHVSQFLIQAFDGVGGNLFMLVLLLAGVVLTTGLSWLTVLDWMGLAVLKTVDWVGGVVMAPLRWMRPRTTGDDNESTTETAPVADSPEATPARSPSGCSQRWSRDLVRLSESGWPNGGRPGRLSRPPRRRFRPRHPRRHSYRLRATSRRPPRPLAAMRRASNRC